ncbi:MAG: hypothetical protein KDD58_04735, partial [Bdellovibrionales bacterium]|nr:hypothetical protein [Bdellovibrionales bacterium]
MNKYFIFFVFVISFTTEAKIRNLELGIEDFLPSPRWEFGDAQIYGLKGQAKLLAEIKKDYLDKKFNSCLIKINKASKVMVSLRPWLSYTALNCVIGSVQKNNTGHEKLMHWLKTAEENKDWWLIGGQKKLLKSSYIKGQLEIFKYQKKNKRSLAWEAFDKVMQYKEVLSNEEMANILREAGELAFLQQKLVTAYDLLTRSLHLKRNSEVDTRLKGIRDLLVEKKLLTPKTLNENKIVNIELEASARENEIFEQMKVALAAGDLVPAIEDGVRLLSEYPSGVRAEDAEKKLLQIYINVSQKNVEKYKSLKTRIFKQMQKVNGQHLYRWGKYLFRKSLHDEAQQFFQVAISKLDASTILSEAYCLFGQSLLFTGEFKKATEAFHKSTLFGAGTDSSERAMFYLGLAYFQMAKLSEAAAQFERLIATRSNSDFQVSAY